MVNSGENTQQQHLNPKWSSKCGTKIRKKNFQRTSLIN